jgi:hypothetical protein
MLSTGFEYTSTSHPSEHAGPVIETGSAAKGRKEMSLSSGEIVPSQNVFSVVL